MKPKEAIAAIDKLFGGKGRVVVIQVDTRPKGSTTVATDYRIELRETAFAEVTSWPGRSLSDCVKKAEKWKEERVKKCGPTMKMK